MNACLIKKRAECFIIRRVSRFRLLNAISLKVIFVSEEIDESAELLGDHLCLF